MTFPRPTLCLARKREFDIRQLRGWHCHWLGFRGRRPLNQPVPSVAGSIYLLAPLELGSAFEPRPECVVDEHQAVAGGERPAMGEIPAQEVCFRPFYDTDVLATRSSLAARYCTKSVIVSSSVRTSMKLCSVAVPGADRPRAKAKTTETNYNVIAR